MRLLVTCELERSAACPINYNHLLTGLVYSLLESSDADYSRFLHDEGFALDEGTKRFKMFVFGWLRGAQRIEGDTIRFLPGRVLWHIASPMEAFLTHCATGLLAGGELRVGTAAFPITQIQAISTPDFASGSAEFSCLSPIVVSKSVPGVPTAEYLRPTSGATFSEAVRCNLLHKHQILHGRPPSDERFAMEFSPAYLEKHRGGTKKVTFKSIDVVGAYCPFRANGSPEMLRLMMECGAGEKSSSGFGMVDVRA